MPGGGGGAGGRNYPADISTQRFLEESINRERDTRLHWYFASRKNNRGPPQGSKQMEVFKRRIEANCPHPTDELLDIKYALEKPFVHEPIDLSLNDGKRLRPLPDMKPINATQRERLGLYTGLSHDGQGRHQYLRSRYGRIPEQKFNFPVLSSWEYGWGLADIRKPDDAQKPEFGRSRIVADSFYNRNGIGLPDLQRAKTTVF